MKSGTFTPPLTGQLPEVEGEQNDAFIDRLTRALKKDGDFPVSARTVSELRLLISDPNTTANQVTEIILREPSLGPRILHIVNSAFYRRVKPIMTVSQAVVQIGMKPLADLCSGLVLLQKFVPLARRGGAFATCLQKMVLTSLMSSSLSNEVSKAPGAAPTAFKSDEAGYLAGSLAELGTLLLAYYFPELYESAIKRAESKKSDLSRSIRELTGHTPLELSVKVLEALDLPRLYGEALTLSEQLRLGPVTTSATTTTDPLQRMSLSLAAARELSQAIVEGKSKEQLDQIVTRGQRMTGIDAKSFTATISKLPELFQGHCTSMDLKLPGLPSYLQTYEENKEVGAGKVLTPTKAEPNVTQFLDEIREAVSHGEPTASVITTVMETMIWSLKFERVVLLLMGPQKRSLIGRMALGNVQKFDPRRYERSLGEGNFIFAPDVQAAKLSRPIFTGDPVLPDGWPLTALPIGFAPRTIGVLYADRVNTSEDLTSSEQAALTMIAELLDRSVSTNA